MGIIEGCKTSNVDRLVRYSCQGGAQKQHVTGSVSVCSDGYHDAIKSSAAAKLGVEVDGVQCSFDETDLEKRADASAVTSTRMARDCGPTYNLRNIIHHNYFTCKYVGPVTFPDGSVAKQRSREYKGMLPSCGVGPDASAGMLQDVRHLVHDAVHGESLGLQPQDFECTIMGVPPH